MLHNTQIYIKLLGESQQTNLDSPLICPISNQPLLSRKPPHRHYELQKPGDQPIRDRFFTLIASHEININCGTSLIQGSKTTGRDETGIGQFQYGMASGEMLPDSWILQTDFDEVNCCNVPKLLLAEIPCMDVNNCWQ